MTFLIFSAALQQPILELPFVSSNIQKLSLIIEKREVAAL